MTCGTGEEFVWGGPLPTLGMCGVSSVESTPVRREGHWMGVGRCGVGMVGSFIVRGVPLPRRRRAARTSHLAVSL